MLEAYLLGKTDECECTTYIYISVDDFISLPRDVTDAKPMPMVIYIETSFD